jgi:hypothetical protein
MLSAMGDGSNDLSLIASPWEIGLHGFRLATPARWKLSDLCIPVGSAKRIAAPFL